jgi:hypothetical protein
LNPNGPFHASWPLTLLVAAFHVPNSRNPR